MIPNFNPKSKNYRFRLHRSANNRIIIQGNQTEPESQKKKRFKVQTDRRTKIHLFWWIMIMIATAIYWKN